MRYVVSILAMVAVAFGMVFFIQAQESGRRRTPKLTNDDLVGTPSTNTGSLPVAANGSIPWQMDLNRALRMAKESHSKVVVDVYTDWCGWCKRMDRDVYTDPKVIALSDRFIFLKLDAEDGGQGERFTREMQVRGYPTTVIIDENGRALTSIRGYPRSVEQFVSSIEAAR